MAYTRIDFVQKRQRQTEFILDSTPLEQHNWLFRFVRYLGRRACHIIKYWVRIYRCFCGIDLRPNGQTLVCTLYICAGFELYIYVSVSQRKVIQRKNSWHKQVFAANGWLSSRMILINGRELHLTLPSSEIGLYVWDLYGDLLEHIYRTPASINALSGNLLCFVFGLQRIGKYWLVATAYTKIGSTMLREKPSVFK